MINITFPDESVRQYEAGVTGYEIAMGISPRLAEQVLAVQVKYPTEPDAPCVSLSGRTMKPRRYSGTALRT